MRLAAAAAGFTGLLPSAVVGAAGDSRPPPSDPAVPAPALAPATAAAGAAATAAPAASWRACSLRMALWCGRFTRSSSRASFMSASVASCSMRTES